MFVFSVIIILFYLLNKNFLENVSDIEVDTRMTIIIIIIIITTTYY